MLKDVRMKASAEKSTYVSGYMRFSKHIGLCKSHLSRCLIPRVCLKFSVSDV